MRKKTARQILGQTVKMEEIELFSAPFREISLSSANLRQKIDSDFEIHESH